MEALRRSVVTTTSITGSDGVVVVPGPSPTVSITYDSPVSVGTGNAEGTNESAARSDHVHDHGNQTTSTHHAVAVSGGANGFMSGTDKSKLDTITPAVVPNSSTGAAYKGAAMTSASAVLTLSGTRGTSSFAAGDVGKAIQVVGAGASGADLHTTIAAYTSATQVTLTAAAGSSVSATSAFWYPVGLDNTSTIQAAIDACSVTHGTVYLSAGVYVVSSTLTGSNFLRCLRGEGMLETFILVSSASFSGDLLSFASIPRGITLADFTLKGPGIASTSSSAAITAYSISGNVLTLTASNNFVVGQSVMLGGFTLTGTSALNDVYGPITTRSATDFTIALTAADDPGGAADAVAHLNHAGVGFGVPSGVSVYIQLDSVQCTRCSGDGFRIWSSIVSSVRNCVALQNGGNGFAIYLTPNQASTSCDMSTCYANANKRAGYYAHTLVYSSFQNLAADSNGVSYYLNAIRNCELVACGSEATISNSAAYPGLHYYVRGGHSNVLTACYATTNTAQADNLAGTYLTITNSAAQILVHAFGCSGTLHLPTVPFQIDTNCVDIVIDSPALGPFANSSYVNNGTRSRITLDGRLRNSVNIAGQNDSASRITLHTDGTGIDFGDGTSAADAIFKRTSAGKVRLEGTTAGGLYLRSTGDAADRIGILNDTNGISFGDGTSAIDTTFKRTGVAVLLANGTLGCTRSYHAVNTVSFSATPVFDLSLGSTIKITLTGNVTSSTTSNLQSSAGQEVTFIVTQDATGGRTVVWPTNTAGVVPAICLDASSVSIVKALSDGTNLNWVGRQICTPISAQAPASDSLSSNSGTQSFATSYTLPPNFLSANRVIRVSFTFGLTTSASPDTCGFILSLGGTAVYNTGNNAPTSNRTNSIGGISFLIQGTAAPGASVNVVTQALHDAGASSSFSPFDGAATSQPVALATNGSLIIQPKYSAGGSTAGNSLQLYQMIVEFLN